MILKLIFTFLYLLPITFEFPPRVKCVCELTAGDTQDPHDADDGGIDGK